MKIEKSLVAYCLIALLIGVASISPLVFITSWTAKAEVIVDKPWYSISSPYAYWKGNYSVYSNGTVLGNQYYSDGAGYSETFAVVFNETLTGSAAPEKVDARFEFYQIQIYSDKGPIGNITQCIGFNRTTNLDSAFRETMSMIVNNDILNSTNLGFTIAQASISNVTKPQLVTVGGPHGLTLFSIFSSDEGIQKGISFIKNSEETDKIYMDIRRLGAITIKGSSFSANLANDEMIQHLQLDKFGSGFLYNSLVPPERLSNETLLTPLQAYWGVTNP